MWFQSGNILLENSKQTRLRIWRSISIDTLEVVLSIEVWYPALGVADSLAPAAWEVDESGFGMIVNEPNYRSNYKLHGNESQYDKPNSCFTYYSFYFLSLWVHVGWIAEIWIKHTHTHRHTKHKGMQIFPITCSPGTSLT